jgi:hypothetical protein
VWLTPAGTVTSADFWLGASGLSDSFEPSQTTSIDWLV